jgi:hypothetical protein
MSICSDDEKILTPEELLLKYDHPYIFYEINRKRFVFKFIYNKIIYKWRFSYRKHKTSLYFEDMLRRIHIRLNIHGIEMSGCGCEERKSIYMDKLKDFLCITEAIFEDESDYHY